MVPRSNFTERSLVLAGGAAISKIHVQGDKGNECGLCPSKERYSAKFAVLEPGVLPFDYA